MQKCEVANSGQVTASAGHLRFCESRNVYPVFYHLPRDEFRITILGERKHVPGSQTKQLMSRWCGACCAWLVPVANLSTPSCWFPDGRRGSCRPGRRPSRYPFFVLLFIIGGSLPRECSDFLGQGRRESLQHPFVSPCPFHHAFTVTKYSWSNIKYSKSFQVTSFNRS